MPRSLPAILALLLPAVVLAQQAADDHRIEIDAATAVARADLKAQLLSVPIAPNVTIRSLNKANPNAVDVPSVLNAAEVVGQPRWIGDDIVQIALRLPASSFIERVRSAGLAAGMKKDELEKFARLWAGRSLQGLGQAIPASRVAAVVTTQQPAAWMDVPDAARLDAANRARQSATGTIVDRAAALQVGPNQYAGDNFNSPDARGKIAAWADTMPATRVNLSDAREVELSVYLDKQGLGEMLRQQLQPAFTASSEKTQAISDRIATMPDVIVGRASAAAVAPSMPRAAVVFQAAPDWASTSLTAEGKSPSSGSLLRTARKAETAARKSLQDRILKLSLPGGATIGDSKDLAVLQAVGRAVDRARVYESDYNPDGSAAVRITLDGGELYDALATPR